MRKIFVTVLLSFISVLAYSQVRSFSQDSAVYIKEVTDYVKESGVESAAETAKVFFEKWTKGAFPQPMQRSIIKMSNELLRKNGKGHPEFSLYLQTLAGFHNSGLMSAKYTSWQQCLDASLKESKGKFMDFLKFSKDLFELNALYKTEVRMWFADSKDFDFSLKNGEVVLTYKGQLNLSCQSVEARDQITIFETRGVLYPLRDVWEGQGGKVNWVKSGLDSTKVYAVLKKYSINVKTSEYKADSVFLYNAEYFKAPVMGSLTDRASPGKISEGKYEYPYFASYTARMAIEKFSGKEARYIGGFAMKGATVVATGTAEQKAEFQFLYKDKPVVSVKATEFIVNSKSIITPKAEISILVDTLNIYHPQVIFNYNKENKEMVMTRGNEGITQAPFFDSYHRVEITVDKIKWKLEEPKIDFVMNNPDAAAIFESANYFRDFRYEKVQGILEYNPISHMYQYAVKTKTREFTLETYAKFWGSKKELMVEQMIYLADRGYIFYDPQTEKIYVKEKIYNYENAHFGRTDYDVIRFESVIKMKPNASLSLINNNLTLEGVREFIFSDSQEVYVKPTEQTITLKKNRNMHFAGRVTAGRVDFYSKHFDFDYLSFKVGPSAIDSMRMYYPDKTGQLHPVQSVIEDINGYLNIDYPNNKSGRRPSTEFPIFTCTTPAAVYYDRPETQGGVYDRKRFYFQVDPFVIDSLDNFTVEGFTFPGTFHSADIFPDIKHELSIRPDYSLGLNLMTPEGGYPMYKGKGKGSMEIDLSNRGLFGKGEITYLTSVSRSDSFLFFPDSMNANCQMFDLPKSAAYPRAIGINIYNHWMPYHDTMYIYSRQQPIKMFDMGYNMVGYIALTPKGLGGNGTVSWDAAEFTSKRMGFGTNKMFADTGAITIRTLDQKKVALYSSNVKGVIDFDKQSGDFKSNIPLMRSQLPYNQYATTLNDFKWDMTGKTILLKTQEPVGSEKAYFISENPKQDSLRFSANTALMDLKTNILTIDKVPFIRVADAKVFPDSGRVVVHEDAFMQTLKNSKVLADTGYKYHNMYSCTIDIYGRNNFHGKGFYDYINKQKQKQKIEFSEIKVDLTNRTVAEGVISDTARFHVSTGIGFKGVVKMRSIEKPLTFDGFLLADHNMNPPNSQWFRFNEKVNPDSVVVSLGTPKDAALRELFTGFAISVDSQKIYPMLFSRKYQPRDIQIHSDSGIFYYDDRTSEFKMGDKEKLLKKAPSGNIIVVNTVEKKTYAEGKVDLNLNFTSMQVQSAGSITRRLDDTVTQLDLMMTIDFMLPDEVIDKMVKFMREGTEGGAPVKTATPGFKNAISELIEPGSRKEVFADMAQYNSVKLVPELRKTFFLTNIKPAWNDGTRMFRYHGQSGLVGIGKNKIDKQVEVFLQIDKKNSGDKIDMCIKAGADHWIYFSYQRGVLSILTNDDETNKLIVEKTEKLQKEDYQIRLATPKQRSMLENHLGESSD